MILVIPPQPEDGRVASGIGTRVVSKDGSEIEGVTRVTLSFAPNKFITAEITVAATAEPTWAMPFMSEESFLEAAKRYGYRVQKETAK